MSKKIEMVSDYREKLVKDLGQWAEDPRSMAAVNARAAREAETMAHMDRPLPHEIRTTDISPVEVYKL